MPGNSAFKSRSGLLFITLTALSLGVWRTPLSSSFGLAASEEQYTHILLILPISAALIFLNWKSDWNSGWKSDWGLTGSSPALSVALSSSCLIIAVLVNVVVRWKAYLSPDIQLATTMLALVVWWIASFVLCFGSRAFRRAFFPLCFLLWMVPLPGFVLNAVVALLQQGSATFAHCLFAAAGIPVAQRGTLVHIPGLTLEVAPECSSIRSSLMLLVTTLVLAQLLLRSTWRKALVVAAAIPLSVAKNGLRIFALGVLATHVDPSFLTGRLHRQGGGIFFLIALAAIFLFLWIVRLDETRRPKLAAVSALPKEISGANA